jgi:SpoVK/Ycf46/Vps4 family AAA+-type ATPase
MYEDESPQEADIEELGPSDAERQEAEEAMTTLREMGVDLLTDEAEAEDAGGFTLGEMEKLVTAMQKIERLGPENPFVRRQWARQSGNYTLIGDTVPTLPAGYYDLSVDQAGNVFFVPLRPRTEKLLRFPDAATDKIVSEIETFWTREKVFQKFGLPFKRGILLYGPPGSGKTCTLQLLARDVVDRGGIVIIYQPELFKVAYRQLRNIQPETPVVVLMEDIDATLERHNESTVLNTLDGTDTIHKTVFVATTNYPEKLGERIINRPSRFDRRLFVDDPSDVARRMYLEEMVRGHKLPRGITVDMMVRDTKGMSLAHVKELFVLSVVIGAPYKEAHANLVEMHFEKPVSANDRDKYGSLKAREGQYI